MSSEPRDARPPGMPREQALELTLQEIRKRCGMGAIMRLDGSQPPPAVEAIACGARTLDRALGIGGFPRGRISEVFGAPSTGKTTLALQLLANAQAEDGLAAFVDAEHALDLAYARSLGVRLDKLLVSQPDHGEQALQIVELLVESNTIDAIAIDSVAALIPRAELEGEMGQDHPASQARLMSQALRKLAASIRRSKTVVVFLNQVRSRVDAQFGPRETTPGGRALKFYASVRIELRRSGTIKQDGDSVGERIRAKVVKNKLAPPFQVGEYDLIYGRGISRLGTLLDVALEVGVVKRHGSWLRFGEEALGRGRLAALKSLGEEPELAAALEAALDEDPGQGKK